MYSNQTPPTLPQQTQLVLPEETGSSTARCGSGLGKVLDQTFSQLQRNLNTLKHFINLAFQSNEHHKRTGKVLIGSLNPSIITNHLCFYA